MFYMANNGYTITEAVVAIVVAAILLFIGYLVLNNPSHSSSTTSLSKNITSQSQYPRTTNNKVLSPATVPSRVPECSQPISYSSIGVPEPYQCSNGYLNATEWQALAALEPSVLALGYNATANQVQSALCSDVKANISNHIEEIVYQIASLYYGWHFNTNPEVVILNGTCQNVDD